MSNPAVTRRTFLAEIATASAALALASRLQAQAEPAAEFRSTWERSPDRPWAGAEFWTNPMQDWQIRGGKLECIAAAPARTVHVLTRELVDRPGTLSMSVRIGRVGGAPLRNGQGAAGFSVGVQGPLREYRNNLIFGRGLNAGFRAPGELFIGDGSDAAVAPIAVGELDTLELRFALQNSDGQQRATLSAHGADGAKLAEVTRDGLPALAGNLALNANFGAVPGIPPLPTPPPPVAPDRWWFADWRIAGTKVVAHPERRFGPIFFNQYTLHAGIMKMTVQLAPLGPQDEQRVQFQVKRGSDWTKAAETKLDPLTRTAAFRIERWDDTRDTPYRIVYAARATDGSVQEDHFEGTIRRDPRDKKSISVADISCNAHYAFPNTECAGSVARLDPDVMAFTGDQYYESTGGYGVDRSGGESSVLDMLRKWAMHGWTWRELMRDRPSVSIPDDHDVYHGNLWGEGGKPAPGHDGRAESLGGYKMTALFVNAVHRTQVSHHPDSPAKPGEQGITGYYGPLTYGGVSFAIVADRQYKSAPDGKVPPTNSGRADHVIDPNFDPKTADLPGLDLLGKPQMEFLRQWTRDWRGAEMKAVISQTIFTAMATHHGPNDMRLIADYDTNAWPQTARNEAVREIRRSFAFHIAGDQHLPAVVHYGVDAHRDGGVAFASPAVNNLYSRRFRPDGAETPTGNFRDSFGHPLTVVACANPKEKFRRGVLEAEMDKSAGFGVVRFDKEARTVTIECWPLLADPKQPGTQFPGWPVVVSQLDNYARPAAAHLPELTIRGAAKPVIELVDESSSELVYTLRLRSNTWRPHAFAAGKYTVRVSEPETGKRKELRGLEASAGNRATLAVEL